MQIKKLTKKLKSKVMATIIATTFAFSAAVIPVKDAKAGCCGETAVLFAIWVAMEFDFYLLYSYLISGIGDVGTGVVGTISGNARAKMSHDETQEGNQAAHYAAVDRTRDAEMIPAKRVINNSPDPSHCSEEAINMASGAAGANSDAALATAAQIAKSNAKTAQNQAGTQPSDTAHAAKVLEEMKKYASDIDAKEGRFASAGSAGMPDGNIRTQSLFTPAHDYTKPDESAKQNLTFTKEQQEAADAVINNMVTRFTPPALPQAVEATPTGKVYIAKTKIFNARLSPAVMALSGIAARRAESPLSGNTQQGWQTASKEYSAIFPGVNKPSAPSEMETLRMEVMRRYAGSDWLTDLKKNSNPARVAQEQAATDAVKLKVLYEIHNRMEENSAVQAAILSQLVNPVSRSEIDNIAQSAFRNK